jgi:translation initiation factor 1A
MEEKKYGDFEEVKEEEKKGKAGAPAEGEEGPVRVRMPRDRELIGVILRRLGGNRMEVKATDGKIRNCRVPGRYKRRLWLRPKDIVMIVPWEDDDNKGDVIYKYRGSSLNQLRKKGIRTVINIKNTGLI